MGSIVNKKKNTKNKKLLNFTSILIAITFVVIVIEIAFVKPKGEFSEPFWESSILPIAYISSGLLIIIIGTKVYEKMSKP
jgi:hypothetical protein